MKNTSELLSIRYRYITIFFFFLFFNFSYSQLSNFTLQLTATNETCAGNGSLSFNITGQTAGSTILYNIFHLPDVTTPIAIVSTNTFTGLVAGNYRVVATQSLGTASNSQQQDISIASQIIPLTFNLVGENEVCGNDGKITVNVTQGNAVSYEIFSGPMIRPLQASSVFTGLTAGAYQVRAFDACGEGVVRTIVVETTSLSVTFRHQSATGACDYVRAIDYLESFGPSIISYPIQVNYILTPPSGPPLNFSQTVSSGNPDSQPVIQNLPLYYGQTYSYIIKVTDSCGNIYTSNTVTINAQMIVWLSSDMASCNDKYIEVRLNDFGVSPFTINFLSAPTGFNPLVYNSMHPQPNYGTYAMYYNSSIRLPAGDYDIEVTDACGRTSRSSITVIYDTSVYPLEFDQRPGCELGYGSVRVSNNRYGIAQAEIVAAPAGYPYSLPHNVTDNISFPSLYLGHLSSGSYTLKTTDRCGSIQYSTVQIIGYQVFSSFVDIIEHCNSFSIDLRHNSNLTSSSSSVYFCLQKFNPLTNEWVHPITNVAIPNVDIYYNSIILNNNTVNNNLTGSGRYRIMKRFFSFSEFSTSGQIPDSCVEEIYNFEYDPGALIKDVYSFSCANGTYEIIVDAEGLEPLIYRITTKDGQPFVINNGNSSLFPGLFPGVYNFQVEDACGNITNRIFEISREVIFPITPSELCAGQPGSLSVPNFPFLHYEWWKDNNTTTILSTTSTLQLNPLSLPADFGTYHVRITNPGNPNSCINEVIDYTISPDMANPNAGGDNNVSYCGSQGVINLFNSLSGTYQANGIWQETTGSGVLNNNLWDSALVNPGVYHFTYTVNGLCGNSDESQVTIEIKSTPQAPVASVAPVVCDAQTFQLFASDIPNATYQWTGPNGFSSTVQNPTIDNASNVNEGIYTVSVFEDGCESNTASVEVFVNRSPAFDIVNECIGNSSSLSAVPLNDSFNVDTAVYSWTYPDGTVVNTNPVTITGQETGSYVLTVTSANGCSASKSIDVLCTNCGIPRGISPNNDGLNDTFDLSCLQGIVNVKIFNRYGMNVYELDNYVDQWDGKDFKGRLLPAATYYYVVKFDTGNVKTGWVYLNY